MKKISISILAVLVGIIFLFAGCKKEKTPKTCNELTNEYTEALTAYFTNPSQATCEAFIASVHKLIDGCATLTPAERAQFEEDIQNADCSK